MFDMDLLLERKRMAVGLLAGIGITAASAIAAKLVSAVWNKLSGTGSNRQRMQQGGGTAGQMGVKTGTTPGGAQVTQIPQLPKKVHDALVKKVAEQISKEPEQLPEMSEIMKTAQETFPDYFKGLEMPAEAELKEFDFEAQDALARQKFHQETIPSIAERFTAMGGAGQRSSGFEGRLGGAAAQLEAMLAGARGEAERGYGLEKAQYGLERGKTQAYMAQAGMKPYEMALQHAGVQRGIRAGDPGLQKAYLGATGYQTALQPPSPTFMQGMAPRLGQAAGQGATLGLNSLYNYLTGGA